MMLPLQAGIPGGPEMLVILLMAGLLLIVPGVFAAFIYRDAKRRNSSHALAWAAAAFLGNWVVWVLEQVKMYTRNTNDRPHPRR
jgi:hypothetical protein